MNKIRFKVRGSQFRLNSSHRKSREEADQFFADGKPRSKKSKMERKRIRLKADKMKVFEHGNDRVGKQKG